jgi:ribosomal protein S18 acetylase RimI-like enzyme
VRPGRAGDLPGVIELWRDEVRAGERDCVPGDARLRRVMAGFDWEARSRMVDGTSVGRLDGAVLVSNRATPLGTVAAVEVSAAHSRPELLHELVRWGLGMSRAAGAVAAQVWRGRGHTDGLNKLGLELVRPWWRMDRSLASEQVVPSPVAGYQLRDATGVPAGTWADVHNLSFADHWRFSPRTEEELMTGRTPALSLMVLSSDGSPAALTVCQIEVYSADRRPQPVGVVSSVGTLHDHRRRGLATWLVAEALLRLHQAGARHASLYVDGLNPMRAFDAYSKLGFELAFEIEVWEATFR